MKITIYLSIFILAGVISCSNPATNAELNQDSIFTDSVITGQADQVEEALSEINDTIFIKRIHKADYYHAIFIEKDRHSKRFQWLFNFDYDDYDQQNYNEMINIAGQIKPLSHHNTKGLAENWLPLYAYKGDYYLYGPSDWGSTQRKQINDSTLVFWFMDGPTPYPIQEIKKVSGKKYEIKYLDLLWKDERLLTIHILDKETMLSAWEFNTGNEEQNDILLFIPSQNSGNYDMIVNYCNMEQVDEFGFDEIDPNILK